MEFEIYHPITPESSVIPNGALFGNEDWVPGCCMIGRRGFVGLPDPDSHASRNYKEQHGKWPVCVNSPFISQHTPKH